MSSPSDMFAPSMSGRVPTYSVIAPGMMFMRNTVGPTTKMNTASTRASAMSMFDSQRMPRATPETAEAIVPRVSTPMIVIASAVPVGGSPGSRAASGPAGSSFLLGVDGSLTPGALSPLARAASPHRNKGTVTVVLCGFRAYDALIPRGRPRPRAATVPRPTSDEAGAPCTPVNAGAASSSCSRRAAA